MTPDHDYGVQTSSTLHLFFYFLVIMSKYVTHMIKNWIKFGYAQISVPKIVIPMSKIACITLLSRLSSLRIFCSFPQKQFKSVALLSIIHTGGLSSQYSQRFDFNNQLQLLQFDQKKVK